MTENTLTGPVHWLWPKSNRCICGWVSSYESPEIIMGEWQRHQESTIRHFPANHRANISRIPGSRSSSPHFEMQCSCGHRFLMPDAHWFFFYTVERMCHEFSSHIGLAKDQDAIAFNERKKALEAAQIQQARHAEAERLRSTIKDRFVLDE